MCGNQLTRDLLQQKLDSLALSKKTLMYLWGIGLNIVGDLVDKTENQLRKELREVKKEGREGVLLEVKRQLLYFNLGFSPEKKNGRKNAAYWEKNGAENTSAAAIPPFRTLVDEETAAQVLGDQFGIFKQFREKSETELRNQIAVNNMRLVLPIAGGYSARLENHYFKGKKKETSLQEEDLRQEGYIGLLRGVEKYDCFSGFRFSTYAVSWIKSFISRFLDEHFSTIYYPVHVSERIKNFSKMVQQAEIDFRQRTGKNPFREDLAQELRMSLEQFEACIVQLHVCIHPVSLDEEISGEESEDDGLTLGDLVEDQRDLAEEHLIKEQFKRAVKQLLAESELLPIEQHFLQLYFGLGDQREHTLEEIGEMYGINRERVRQRIEKSLYLLRTQTNWGKMRQYNPHIPQPSVIRKFDLELGSSSLQKVKFKKRSPEDIAHEILRAVALEYKTDSDTLKRGGEISDQNKLARRKIVEVCVGKAKLSSKFLAGFFNMTEEEVIRETECIKEEKVKGKISAGVEIKKHWQWNAMSVVIQVSEKYGCNPSDIFDFHEHESAVNARREIVYRLRHELEVSFKDIRKFMNRSASSVNEMYLEYVKSLKQI